MEKRALSELLLALLLVGMWASALNIRTVQATETIYIRADGSVEPPTAPIQRNGDLYTFSDNVYAEIVVERDNIVIDGAFYTLQGNGSGIGIALFDKSARASSNVTIMNMQITAFMGGIMGGHSDTRIQGNNITANRWGIYLDGNAENNNIYRNNIRNNSEGITLVEADGISIFENNIENNTRGVAVARVGGNFFYHNNFINNTDQVYIIGSPHCINSWDKGNPSGGNHWSDYNGVDSNGDGLGDTPYIIDADNQDRYPLIDRWTPPTVEPLPEVVSSPFWMQWWFYAIVAAIIFALAGIVNFLKRRKPSTLTAPPRLTEGT